MLAQRNGERAPFSYAYPNSKFDGYMGKEATHRSLRLDTAPPKIFFQVGLWADDAQKIKELKQD